MLLKLVFKCFWRGYEDKLIKFLKKSVIYSVMNKRGISPLLLVIIAFGSIVLISLTFILYNNYLTLNSNSSPSGITSQPNLESSFSNPRGNQQDNTQDAIDSINQTNIYPAPEGYSLLSDFFKDDSIAISIIDGGSYNLSDNNLYITQGNVDFSSFEFKLINAFKQMGYTGLTTYISSEDSASTYSLHRFEERNNLSPSNILDGRTLALIDTKLFNIEAKDKTDSAKYPPLTKFIKSPLNEPTKEHLAALFYRFYQSLPINIPLDKINLARTIDEFRASLTSGMGRNLGSMLDASETRILIPSEMVDFLNNQSDFKFCASSYYLAFNSPVGGNCINPPTKLNNVYGIESDYDYFYLFTHEFSHGVGHTLITINGNVDRIDYQFGKISFGGNFSCGFEICSSNNVYWLRQENNYGEFITPYAREGYTGGGFTQGTLAPHEDFAESFAFYMLQGNVFRERAKNNIYLQQKYDFLREYIFEGVEYNTGNLDYYNSWLSENPNATPQQKLYNLMENLKSNLNIGIWSEDYPAL